MRIGRSNFITSSSQVLFGGFLCWAGLAGKKHIDVLHQPTRQVLASAISPDRAQQCVVERFEPAEYGDASAQPAWRVLKVFPVDVEQRPGSGTTTSMTIQELLSGGLEIGGKSNQVRWSGSKAIILFDNELWFEFDTATTHGWQMVQSTSKPGNATTKPA